jgi:hypothetical protein
MAEAKRVELYFYEDGDGDQRVPNRMPAFRDGGLYDPLNDADCYSMDICDDGRKVFGIDGEVPEGRIVRVTVAVEAVEAGEYKVQAEFKPFAPVKPRRRRRS